MDIHEIIKSYIQFCKIMQNKTNNYLIVLNENRKLEHIPLLVNNFGVNFSYATHSQNFFVLEVSFEKKSNNEILSLITSLSEKERFFLQRGYMSTSLDWLQDGDFRKSNIPFFIASNYTPWGDPICGQPYTPKYNSDGTSIPPPPPPRR